ncbi:AAA family ATPase [Lagierella sp. ICN-221743]
MKLLKLEISGFGKFENKIIDLDEDFILIRGDNEAGKSTCVKFIEGVFYGFVKPYLKTTRYTDDLEKYRPWNCSNYEGSIIFEYKGEILRVYRNFQTGEYKIYNEKSGKDITDTLNGYKQSNKSFPGEYFFKVSSEVFNNTKIIGQNNVGIKDQATRYITDTMLKKRDNHEDLTTSKKSVEYLKELRRDIGTATNSNKPLGRAYEDYKTLSSELKRLSELKEEYDNSLNKLSDLERKYVDKNNLFELKEKQLSFEKQEIDAKVLYEKDELLNEISNLNKKISEIENSKKIYEPYLKEYDKIKDEEKYLKKAFDELSQEKRQVYKKYLDISKILDDAVKDNKKCEKSVKIRYFIVFLFSIIASYLLRQYTKLSSTTIFMIFVMVNLISFMIQNRHSGKLDAKEYEKVKSDRDFYLKKIEELDREIEYLLNDEENKNNSLLDIDKIINDKFNIGIKEIKDLDEELFNCEKKLKESKSKLDFIVKTKPITKSLKVYNVEFSKDFYMVENMNIEELRNEKDLLNNEIVKIKERIKILDSEIINLPSLLDKENSTSKKIEELENNLRIIDLTIKLVEESFEELKSSFVPKLINKVNLLLKPIYEDNIKFYIDEFLNISYKENASSNIKSSLSLGKGSQDIIFFVLKIAICTELYDKSGFLILDDAFNYLDDDRLKIIISVLKKELVLNQIIILSCQEREMEILKSHQDVKIINL